MKLLAILVLLALAYAKRKKYSRWKTYYITTSTADMVEELSSLVAKMNLDFISSPKENRQAIVLVKPRLQEEFTKKLDELGINYKTHANNVKLVLDHDDEVIQDWTVSFFREGSKSKPYTNYQRLDVIYAYMADIAARYRENATLMTAAKSFEGRPIKYMNISTTNFQDSRKPVIFIDGGMHSREWIAPPTVVWVIKKLTEDVTEPDLLDQFDWILLPVVNPDGYEYTFIRDRFWRKTRSNNTHSNSSICLGVDINRNYDYLWDKINNKNPCAKVYPGNRPFSEVETKTVKDLLERHKYRTAFYLSMHSHGSMILYPKPRNTTTSNRLRLHSVGIAMAKAINNVSLPSFPRYSVSQANILHKGPASGMSLDYAYSVVGVPLAYVIELPGLLEHLDGFVLEPRFIVQVCRETWAGIVVGAKNAGQSWKERMIHV